MKKVYGVLSLILSVWCLPAMAQDIDVKVEFITPSIIHVVKGQPTKSLVVIAKPEQLALTQKGNTCKSSEA